MRERGHEERGRHLAAIREVCDELVCAVGEREDEASPALRDLRGDEERKDLGLPPDDPALAAGGEDAEGLPVAAPPQAPTASAASVTVARRGSRNRI